MKAKTKLRWKHFWRGTKYYGLRGILLAIVVVAVNRFFHYYGDRVLSFMRAHARPANFGIIIAYSVIQLGFLAGKLKGANRILFGNIQQLFGAVSAITIALGLPTNNISFERWCTLLACVYLIADGYGNVIEGTEKRDATKERTLVPLLKRSNAQQQNPP